MTRLPDAALAFEAGRSSPAPAYADHFGLARAPFDPAADSRFLYASRSYSAVQAQLLESLKRREALVVLTGPTGTGKTTLYRSLLRGLPQPAVVSEIINPFLNSDDLLKQVLVDFGAVADVTAADKLVGLSGHDLLLLLRRFLEGLPASARAVIVIDDAHQLQRRVLRQLRSLANLQGKAPQILLVGQPALTELFQHPEVRHLGERVVRRCEVTPLSSDEVLLYLEHRLSAAVVTRALTSEGPTGPAEPYGDRSSIHLTIHPGAVRQLASLSRGVPRTLNLLGDRTLDVAYERGTHDIDRRVVNEAAKRLGLRLSIAPQLRTLWPAVPIAAAALLAMVALVWLGSGIEWRQGFNRLTAWSARTAARPAPRPKDVAATAPPTPTPARVASTNPSAKSADASRTDGSKVEVLETADSFAVLIGSFRNRQTADEAVAALAKVGLSAFVRSDGVWNLIIAGPYVTAAEAADALDQVPHRRFPDAHVQRQSVQALNH